LLSTKDDGFANVNGGIKVDMIAGHFIIKFAFLFMEASIGLLPNVKDGIVHASWTLATIKGPWSAPGGPSLLEVVNLDAGHFVDDECELLREEEVWMVLLVMNNEHQKTLNN